MIPISDVESLYSQACVGGSRKQSTDPGLAIDPERLRLSVTQRIDLLDTFLAVLLMYQIRLYPHTQYVLVSC